MGNPTADLTVKSYTHPEKRGKDITKATAGSCNYDKNTGVIPQTTPVRSYIRKSQPNRGNNPAVVGMVSASVVSKCRNTDPATAGITTKRVGGN